MLESVVAYFTVGMTASVFALALAVEPHDIEIADVSLAESIVTSGYDELAVEHALKADIDELVEFTASHHAAEEVKVNLVRGGYDRLANMLGVEEAIQAIQQVLGVTGSLVSLRFVEEEGGSLAAAVYIRDPRNLRMLGNARLQVDGADMPLLIQRTAAEILAITEPYIYATFLHHVEHDRVTDEHDALLSHSTTEWIDLQILKADQDDPDLPWYLNLRGIVAMDAKDYDNAIGSFSEALMLDGEFTPALINLGQVSLELDSPEQALRYLERTFSRDSEYPITRVHAARALLQMDMPGEALEQLDRAMEIAPDMALAYQTRADVLKHMGKLLSANVALEDARIATIKRPNQNYFDAD